MSASTSTDPRERTLVLGAAGRDFHDFNVALPEDPAVEVVAFTAAQIPDIEPHLPAGAGRAAVPARHPDRRRVGARGR